MLRLLASVILVICAIKSSGSDAAVMPSVTPSRQQEPNPAPVPAQQLRFPAGRTKNNDPNADSGDYSICFPYFISQDIESLLAQAIRMLDRVADGRQKSWLLVFVQRLDSLSRQLQSLPVKHRNMCFQKNHQLNLQAEGDEEEQEYGEHPVETYPDVIPDDVQLENARIFFEESNADHPRQRNGHEQYITGKVFDRLQPGMVHHPTSKRYHDKGHLQQQDDGPSFTEPVHVTGTDIPKSRESEEQNGHPAIPASIHFMVPVIPSDRDDDAESPLDREMVPVNFKPASSIPSMTYENMPFLPRSTRKGIHKLIVDKLRYHPHQNRDRDNNLHQPQQQYSSPPTTTEPFLQSRTLVGPDDVTNGGTSAGDNNNNHHHQQFSGNNQELASHRSGLSERDKTSRDVIGIAAASQTHKEPNDEIVNQLHSSGVAMVHQDRPDLKIPESSILIDSRIPLTTEQIESKAAHSGQHNIDSGEHREEYPKNYGKYDYRKIPYHYDNNNNLDFEYEDQGAAAGELYAEEDNNSARLLAAVPPPTRVGSSDIDAAVRQLHELKSSMARDHQHQTSGSTSTNNNNSQMQTSQAYPTETSNKLEHRDVEDH